MSDSTSELPLSEKNAPGCSCCNGGADSAAAEPVGGITLHVQGMTCSHCVSSVTEELEEVDGVRKVSVDLDPIGTSTVIVDADPSIGTARLHTAVTEAGYRVVTSS